VILTLTTTHRTGLERLRPHWFRYRQSARGLLPELRPGQRLTDAASGFCHTCDRDAGASGPSPMRPKPARFAEVARDFKTNCCTTGPRRHIYPKRIAWSLRRTIFASRINSAMHRSTQRLLSFSIKSVGQPPAEVLMLTLKQPVKRSRPTAAKLGEPLA
jgi:hypothetical protein